MSQFRCRPAGGPRSGQQTPGNDTLRARFRVVSRRFLGALVLQAGGAQAEAVGSGKQAGRDGSPGESVQSTSGRWATIWSRNAGKRHSRSPNSGRFSAFPELSVLVLRARRCFRPGVLQAEGALGRGCSGRGASGRGCFRPGCFRRGASGRDASGRQVFRTGCGSGGTRGDARWVSSEDGGAN